MYEDENTNYNYEKGAFSTIDFTYNGTNKIFSIGNRKGNFTGMVKEHSFNIVYIKLGKSNGIDILSADVRSIHYNGNEISTCFKNRSKIK